MGIEFWPCFEPEVGLETSWDTSTPNDSNIPKDASFEMATLHHLLLENKAVNVVI